MTHQATSTIMMVRPSNFGFNTETAASNTFQINDHSLNTSQIAQNALKEFDRFVEELRSYGIEVIVVQDTPKPIKPDAIFPNNWVSFHQDGKVITYPMQANNRQNEIRNDVLNVLSQEFEFNQRIQLDKFANQELYLEGTGSMIFDRPNQIIYACISPRTQPTLVQNLGDWIMYKPVLFRAVDPHGQEIYHTNVMMAVADAFVVICLDSVLDPLQRQMLLQSFEQTQKQVVPISYEQMKTFAGNMIQLRNAKNETFMVMSTQAYNSLNSQQIDIIQKYSKIIHSPIPTIETYGGGSARCMIAEVFSEKKK